MLDLFFRASNTMAGLYTSRKLLAYHSGTLQFLANEEQGTTAVARVPLSSKAADHVPPNEELMV